ncbi:MAG TPA: hypothetical protein VIU61_10895 [Kofleriaceae bacterium]
MRLVLAVVILAALSAPAIADVSINLKHPDPTFQLPLIAADGTNFLRAFRRYKRGCKSSDLFVEDGGIDASVAEPQYSQTQLLGGCGEAREAFAGNVAPVNESMRGTKCKTAAKRGRLAKRVPATFEADGMRVDVTGNATSAHITINRLDRAVAGAWTGGRRMGTETAVFDVRAWYLVDQKDRRQLAVLVGGRQRDGTTIERWIEVWATKAPAKPSKDPVEVAKRWLLALAARDAKALAAASAAPFERIGFEPPGERGKACEAKRKAQKPAELAPVLDCALGESLRYASFYDEQEFAKLGKRGPELEPHGKTLQALAGKGLQLVAFSTDTATVVFGVKGDKVAAVVEAKVKK